MRWRSESGGYTPHDEQREGRVKHTAKEMSAATVKSLPTKKFTTP